MDTPTHALWREGLMRTSKQELKLLTASIRVLWVKVDLFVTGTSASGGRVLALKFQAPDVIGPTSNWRTSAHLHGSTNPSCNRPCQQDLAAVNPHHQCASHPLCF